MLERTLNGQIKGVEKANGLCQMQKALAAVHMIVNASCREYLARARSCVMP